MNVDGRSAGSCDHQDPAILDELIGALGLHRSVVGRVCWLLATVVVFYLALTVFYAIVAIPTGLGLVYGMYLFPAGLVLLILLRFFRSPDVRSAQNVNCPHGHAVRLVSAKATRLRAIHGFTFMVSGAVSALAGITAQSGDVSLLHVLLGAQLFVIAGWFGATVRAYRDYKRANDCVLVALIAEREDQVST
jgi:hypothetical protein